MYWCYFLHTAPELVLTIGGSGFIADSQAQWNGESRPTTFVSETELKIAINAADLSAPGSATVTVVNPAPGGGTSNPATFQIGQVGDNPIPAISGAGLSPGLAAGDTLTVRVLGSGFIAGSQAQWNGQARPTTFVSETELSVTIAPSDYSRGSAVITVANPAPGGGASNEWLFGVRRLFLPLVLR